MRIRKFINKMHERICYNYPLKHEYYGDVYVPRYNLSVPFSGDVPKYYNSEGRELDRFFVSDDCSAHSPFWHSKYIFADRYNFGLDTHWYTHQSILKTMGKPVFRYACLGESEAICPEDYKIFDKHKGLEKDFDLVFTYSDRLLEKLPNARFAPFCTVPWYGSKQYGGELTGTEVHNKKKDISIIASKQYITENHKLRVNTAINCKKNNLADTFGAFDGGAFIQDISVVFKDYRYSIVIENDIKPYYFTEKITNCFASMTVPIYLGTTKIAEFFNPDGIIFAKKEDFENLPKLLSQCSEKDYEQRIPAIIDNYNRVLKYLNTIDNLYEKYLMDRRMQ